MNTLLPAIALVALLLFGVVRWRQALLLALVLLIFEGAIRKWLLPEFQVWVYFGKDFLLLGAYLAYFRARLRRGQPLAEPHAANVWLTLVVLYCLVEVANPASLSPLLALFGLRAYLIYIPLIYVLPAAFPDHLAVRKVAILLCILSLAPLLIGPIQFASPLDSVWNRYAWADETGSAIATMPGRYARITGTFPYISGYTTFLQLVATGALVALLWAPSWRARLVVGGVLVLSLGNLFMTGSRGPFILVIISALLVLLYLAQSGRAFHVRPLLTVLVLVPALWLLATTVFGDALDSFVTRAQDNDAEGIHRVVMVWEGPLWALGEAGFAGFGIGSTHQITSLVLGSTADRSGGPPPAEAEWDRIILELGPLGFGLVMALRVVVVLNLWRRLRASRGQPMEPFLLTAFAFTVVSLPTTIVFNATAGMLFWLLAALASLPVQQAAASPMSVLAPSRAGSAMPASARRVITGAPR